MSETDLPNRQYEVAALKRGLLILDCFLSDPQRTLAVSEVARAVGIHRATAFRFLSTLEAAGYLEQTGRPGGYRLAAKCRRGEPQPLWPPALPLISVSTLKELVDETGETADIGVLHQGQSMLVMVVEGSQSVRVLQHVGAMRPAHLTALGKVLLAAMDEAALEEWLREHPLEVRTPNSIGTPQRLRVELAEIRQSGYAVDEQEYELGLTCIAAPVRDASGSTIAGVAISAPSSRVTYHRLPELVGTVQRAADRLSAALGAPMVGVHSPDSLAHSALEVASSNIRTPNYGH